MFESSVNSYDSQTYPCVADGDNMFESSVNSYDSQTDIFSIFGGVSLRVV